MTGHEHLLILGSGSPRRRELLALLDLPFIIVLPEGDSSTLPLSTGVAGNIETPVSQGGVDESPLPGELPSNLVQRLSRAKARAVAARLPLLNLPELGSSAAASVKRPAIIIAADTVVASGDKILGKPANPSEATEMLKALRQQKCHFVYSGLTVGLWRENALSQDLQDIREESVTGKTDHSTRAYRLRIVTRLHQSKVWMRAYSDAEIDTYVASGDPLDKAGAYAIQHKIFAPVERLEGCFASVMGLPLGDLASALNEMGLSLPEIVPRCARYSDYPCCQQTVDAGQ